MIDRPAHRRRPGGVNLAVIDPAEIHAEKIRQRQRPGGKGPHGYKFAGDVKEISDHERIPHVVDKPDVPHRILRRG
jgi:hypothetical protein